MKKNLIARCLLVYLQISILLLAYPQKVIFATDLMDQIEQLEEQGIDIGLAMEIEAFRETVVTDEGGETIDDLELATLELSLQTDITDWLGFSLVSDYDTEAGVKLDETFLEFQVSLGSEDRDNKEMLYLALGQTYLPFGWFESHFIADPPTVPLGETRHITMVVGIESESITLTAGFFDRDSDGLEKPLRFDQFALAAEMDLPDLDIDGLDITTGFSFTSDISTSLDLHAFIEENFDPEERAPRQNGAAGFVAIGWQDFIFIQFETVRSLNNISDEADERFAPMAWSLEAAVKPIETLTCAIRYGGSENGLDFLPHLEYGLGLSYELTEFIRIAAEYLFNEYGVEEKTHTLTTQFSIEL